MTCSVHNGHHRDAALAMHCQPKRCAAQVLGQVADDDDDGVALDMKSTAVVACHTVSCRTSYQSAIAERARRPARPRPNLHRGSDKGAPAMLS